MSCPITQSLNAHLSKLDAQDEKEHAIEMLAEQLSTAASTGISNFLRLSNYSFEYKHINNETNGSDEFNEMLYKVAENLINSIGK